MHGVQRSRTIYKGGKDAVDATNQAAAADSGGHAGRKKIIKKAASGPPGAALAGVRLGQGRSSGAATTPELFESGEVMRAAPGKLLLLLLLLLSQVNYYYYYSLHTPTAHT